MCYWQVKIEDLGYPARFKEMDGCKTWATKAECSGCSTMEVVGWWWQIRLPKMQKRSWDKKSIKEKVSIRPSTKERRTGQTKFTKAKSQTKRMSKERCWLKVIKKDPDWKKPVCSRVWIKAAMQCRSKICLVPVSMSERIKTIHGKPLWAVHRCMADADDRKLIELEREGLLFGTKV